MKRMIRSCDQLVSASIYHHSERHLKGPLMKIIRKRERLMATVNKTIANDVRDLQLKYGPIAGDVCSNGLSELLLGMSSKPTKHVMKTSKKVTKKTTKRFDNETNLVDCILHVLNKSSEPLDVGEIMAKVKSQGYRSTSKNFRGIVNQTLIKHRDIFKSTARGVYTVK